MFKVNVDHQEAALKPMNCPSHCLIYKEILKVTEIYHIELQIFAHFIEMKLQVP